MIIDRLFSKNKNKFEKRDTINNKGEGEQVLRFITKSTGNFFFRCRTSRQASRELGTVAMA